jgi:hypothetical protein
VRQAALKLDNSGGIPHHHRRQDRIWLLALFADIFFKLCDSMWSAEKAAIVFLIALRKR